MQTKSPLLAEGGETCCLLYIEEMKKGGGGGGGWQNRSFPEVDGDSSTHGIAEIEHLHPARLHLYIV